MGCFIKILIDGDVELYRACEANEQIFDWNDGLHTLVSDSVESRQIMIEAINGHKKVIGDWLGTGDLSVIVCFSGNNNWRKLVYPRYKADRVKHRRPIAFKPVKEWFLKNYDSRINEHLEADDLLGILSTSDPDDCVIVSIDKDLQSVPGYLFNPDKDRQPHLRSLDEANHFHVFQTLMGDKTDGYPGCPGIGPVKALRALRKPGELPLTELWERAKNLYKRAGRLQEIEAQAKVARILRNGEWCEKTNRCLWEIPNGL